MRQLDEKSMSNLEKHIPELAEGAVKQAYCKALTSGRRQIGVRATHFTFCSSTYP